MGRKNKWRHQVDLKQQLDVVQQSEPVETKNVHNYKHDVRREMFHIVWITIVLLALLGAIYWFAQDYPYINNWAKSFYEFLNI